MKIALNTYQSAYQNPGGGEVVLNKHYEHLKARGHKVELFNQWTTKIKDFDLIHSFGSINRDFWFAVKSANVPLIVTPILWPQRTLFNRICGPFGRMVKKASPYTKNPFKIYYEFRLPDRLIVNSQAEADRIQKVYQLDMAQFAVVPNGVDKGFREAEPTQFIERYQTRDFLLCVGRIASVKNQLGLIRAAQGLSAGLVFIGSPEPSSMDYYQQCRKEASPDTLFIDRVDQGAPLLASAFAAAKMVVIPSLFETCGIVAMEAGLAGAPVAITRHGGTREYYKDFVSYLDPDSTTSLRNSLIAAMATKKDTALFRAYIEQNYLWERVMDWTIEIYRSVLRNKQTDEAVDPNIDIDLEQHGPVYIKDNNAPFIGDRL
jgi:glycosyltransferase involved in cell wall biosynthesis